MSKVFFFWEEKVLLTILDSQAEENVSECGNRHAKKWKEKKKHGPSKLEREREYWGGSDESRRGSGGGEKEARVKKAPFSLL